MKTHTYEFRKCICQDANVCHPPYFTSCAHPGCDCQKFIPDKWWTRIVFRRLVTHFALRKELEATQYAPRKGDCA